MSTETAGSTGDSAPERLRHALERALATDADALSRLSHARTSVVFRVAGTDSATTLLLDRKPPAVVTGHDPEAEIEVELRPDQVNAFVTGQLALTPAVMYREVHTRGPIRKFLEVDIVLRNALATASGTGEARRHASTENLRASRNGDQPDTDLLAIQTLDLHKSFGSQRVLAGLNLDIPEGVVATVLGPSGTGKSVLLNHIIGLFRPDAGDVLIRGRALSGMSSSEMLALRREIGVMFQDGALFSTMNVYDNTAFPLRQHTNLREPQIREVVMERLGEVGLADSIDKMPNELSGGMRKRAGLARALVLDPNILLCDEPDSGLDPVRTSLLADLLLEQHAQTGGTMLVVTHDIRLARHISDHISVLWQGQLVISGFKDEVLNADNEFVQQFLSGRPDGPLDMD
jgi:phospholipid/cholesterol/gamma-HCH transport system ATP-binding protein